MKIELKTLRRLLMFCLMILSRAVIACPHPDLQAEFPDNIIWKQQYYSHLHMQELDADSIHSYDAQELYATFIPNIPARSFYVTVRLIVEIREADLESLSFHLNGNTIVALVVTNIPITHRRVGDTVTITFREPLLLGSRIEINIAYTGQMSLNNNEGGFIYSQLRNVLYTYGEPYQTRDWLACYDQPFDKLDVMEMTIILDEAYKVVSNGFLVEEASLGDGTVRTVWRSEQPISTYLISLAAHPYTMIPSGVYGINDTPVHFWAYRPDSALAAFEFGRTGEMIEFFESLFGHYPFNKYDQAMAPLFDGYGAMEHQTVTTYGDFLVRRGNRQYENIVAHELAHQWWGDCVGPLTFAHIWLNEGFASYAEALWAEHLNPSRLRTTMNNFRNQYLQEDENIRYALFNPPEDHLFGRVVYKKGAWVLHTLRGIVGDDLFFQSLRIYRNSYTEGSAVTDELRQIFEEVCNIDLEAFFNEWVYQAGHPVYNFNNFTVIPEVGGNLVTIDIQQLQENAPYFSTPLPFAVSGIGGNELVWVEVEPVAEQTLELGRFPFLPTDYEFDPDHWILCLFTENPPEGNSLNIPLASNYFEMISSNRTPANLQVDQVFANVAGLVIVYQNDGHIYLPPLINTIGAVSLFQGYRVFCDQPAELVIEGELVDPVMQYTILARRWNWIGYPFNVSLQITTALSEILDDIMIVMTDDGRYYIPPLINTIEEMTPGEGYMVFTNNDRVFTYNSGNLLRAGGTGQKR